MSLQADAAYWHKTNHPDDGIYKMLAKAAEELGELARACIAIDEARPGRGDPGHEAVDTVLVILSLVGRYFPDTDVLAELAKRVDPWCPQCGMHKSHPCYMEVDRHE